MVRSFHSAPPHGMTCPQHAWPQSQLETKGTGQESGGTEGSAQGRWKDQERVGTASRGWGSSEADLASAWSPGGPESPPPPPLWPLTEQQRL